jgi:hypothetical protein
MADSRVAATHPGTSTFSRRDFPLDNQNTEPHRLSRRLGTGRGWGLNRSIRYFPELRDQAVRMLQEHQAEYGSQCVSLQYATTRRNSDLQGTRSHIRRTRSSSRRRKMRTGTGGEVNCYDDAGCIERHFASTSSGPPTGPATRRGSPTSRPLATGSTVS